VSAAALVTNQPALISLSASTPNQRRLALLTSVIVVLDNRLNLNDLCLDQTTRVQ